MKLVWTPQAIEDRKHIFAFIYEHDEEAAEAMDKLFVSQAAFLLDYPQKGRAGRVAGTRELVVHKHYLLVYACVEDHITVLTVLHTSRNWPPLLTL